MLCSFKKQRLLILYVYFLFVSKSCTNVSGNANVFDINTSGLILLSKSPLKDARFVGFYGETINTFDRGYLQAQV